MSEKDDILIDAYLRGILLSEDEILLEQRLKDANFKKKFDEAILLVQVLKEEDAKKMKARLNILEKEESDITRSNINISYLKLIISILGILAIAAILYFSLKPKSFDNQQIYAAFYEPYPNIIDPIVKGDSDSLTIYQYYELKNYDRVIQNLSSQSTLNLDEQFYLASSYLEINNDLKTSELLEVLKKSEKYADPSQWYLALICIKQEKSTCKAMVEAISSDGTNIYNRKAAELLEKL